MSPLARRLPLQPRVTAPRQVLPGTTYLVTRRCSERRLFLRPSERVNAIFLYVLAVAAQRYGIDVHAFCVLSNHYHLLLTDTNARLPAFVQYLDSLVARAMNASLGRWEGFWSSEASYSAVSNTAPEDVISKAAYILANPVAAGLVSTGSEWPGLWTASDQLGVATFTAKRPDFFFSRKGRMPKEVQLSLTTPPGFKSAAAFREAVAASVHKLEEEHRSARARTGFLGREAVLAQKPTSHPRGGEPRRTLSPRIAARDKWKRIEAITRLKDFLHAYHAAWLARRAGEPDVIFPAGTYQLRVEHGVRCAA